MDKTELKEAFERMDVHVTEKEVDLLLKRYNNEKIFFLILNTDLYYTNRQLS